MIISLSEVRRKSKILIDIVLSSASMLLIIRCPIGSFRHLYKNPSGKIYVFQERLKFMLTFASKYALLLVRYTYCSSLLLLLGTRISHHYHLSVTPQCRKKVTLLVRSDNVTDKQTRVRCERRRNWILSRFRCIYHWYVYLDFSVSDSMSTYI